MKVSAAVSILAMVLLCFDWAYENGLTLCYILLVVASAMIPVFMTVANIYSGQYADRYSKNARSVVLGISRLAFNVGQVIGPVIATSCIQYGGENYYFYAGSAVVFTAVFVNWLVQHGKLVETILKEKQMAAGAGEEEKEKDADEEKAVSLELVPQVPE
jgi:MFS family permease